MAPKVKIVGLGDSTTAGTPAFKSPIEAPPSGRGNPESQYGFWMSKLHPEWDVLNRGINGERTDQILERFDSNVRQEKPDYSIILGGVNDVFQGYPIDFTERNLEKMYTMTQAAGIVLLAATVLPYDSMSSKQASAMREINAWIRSRSAQLSALYCDTNAAVSLPGDWDRLAGTPDGLHPDVAGYRRMGEALARTIEEHLSGV